jgi:hypothetical protein
MSSKRDWRDPAPYQTAQTLSPPDLAWEFLRRDPAYQKTWQAGRGHSASAADDAAGRWGLRFRARPPSCRP